MKLLTRVLVAALLSATLISCKSESPDLDDPYRSANNTAVYRVKWSGSKGSMYNMQGDHKGDIWKSDMADFDDSGIGYVNGYKLDGWMYYNPNANRLYLEDSLGGVGKAINTYTNSVGDTNWAGQAAEAREDLIKSVAQGLHDNFSLPKAKAMAVASALQTYQETKVARGYSTDKDVQTSFKAVFGVEYGSAMAAVTSFRDGSSSQLKDLTQRTSAHLGIQPHQAQRFMKEMYRNSLESNGYNVEDLNW